MAKAKDKKVILDTSGDLLKEGIKANYDKAKQRRDGKLAWNKHKQ